MKLLQIAEQNKKYYTEEFIHGFNTGAKAQYEADRKDAKRRGRWVFNIDDKGWSWDKPYMCDQCGEWVEKVFKFCPNCGAKMEAKENEND